MREEIKDLIVLILMITLFFLSFLIPSREPKKAEYIIINLSEDVTPNYPTNYQCRFIKIENNIMTSECLAVNKEWICNVIRHTDSTTGITENEMKCVQCWASYGDECIVPIKNQTTDLNS